MSAETPPDAATLITSHQRVATPDTSSINASDAWLASAISNLLDFLEEKSATPISLDSQEHPPTEPQ